MASNLARKDKDLHFRVSEEEKTVIEQAAKIQHLKTTEFVLNAAYNKALEVLEISSQVKLQKAAWENFCLALEAPAVDLPNLRKNLLEDSRKYQFE